MTLAAVVFAMTVTAGPLADLLPQPKRMVPSEGTAASAALTAVKTVKGVPAGVPSHLAAEAYGLEITPQGVTITANDPKGERYARVTLDQLVKLSKGAVPCCRIEDWPTFPYRGVMHDCGRNFLEMKGVKAILDMMVAYKFNLFHWHITDYYGWRLESKKYPMLQAPWAFRRQTGKYYTQKDFREIIDYAAARGITVMPEIDVPGHTLAFRKGLGIEFMNDERAAKIVGELLDELCTLATPAEMPYVHLGTDEARTSYEMVVPRKVSAWAERLCKNGRTPVAWTPGIPLHCSKPAVKMYWGLAFDRAAAGDFSDPALSPAFDSHNLYFGSDDPFTLLAVATAAKPCPWDGPAANKLGPIMCSWHDDFLGEDTLQLFRNIAFFPAMVSFSDMFWNSNAEEDPQHLRDLPGADTPAFARVEALDRRIVAQRDRVLADLPYPFSYVRQSQMRWRITTERGAVVAAEAVGGTHYFGTSSKVHTNVAQTVVLQTWIRSPKAQRVGAWIGFSSYGRSGGRRGPNLPEQGNWRPSTSGSAEVVLNGKVIPPPTWERPGPVFRAQHPEEPTSAYISELPFTNEEYFMREPTPIDLKEGWNEVRLTVTQKKHLGWGENWCATFVPVSGTSAHPHEVENLAYSAVKPEE